MKRKPPFLPTNLTRLYLTLEDLEVLLNDEGGVLSRILGLPGSNIAQNESKQDPDHALFDVAADFTIQSDDDLCLYFVPEPRHARPVASYSIEFVFVDTTDLPEWQGILRYLHWEQHGLNSLGDE